MAVFPKSPGDVLGAVDWNIAAAQADDALKPSGNLAGLANAATARTNLGLATVAATGDHDDLTNRPINTQTNPETFLLVDEYGFAVMAVNGAGTAATMIPQTSVTSQTFVDSEGLKIDAEAGAIAMEIRDEYGFTVGRVDATGVGTGIFGGTTSGGGGAAATTHTDAEIDARNGVNLGLAGGMASRIDHKVARPVYKYNQVVIYGQSLSTGSEGTPPLSATAKYGSLMLGNQVQSLYNLTSNIVGTPPVWTCDGTEQYNALVATTGNEGIGPTAAAMFRRAWFQTRGLTADADRLMVVSGAGVGGVAIAALSKAASPEYYNRLIDLVTKSKAVADGLSGSYGIAAFIWMQGESNTGTSRASYLASLRALYADFIADCAVTVAGQADPPAMFTYQTTATSTSDTNALGVHMAQLDMATTDAGVYMVGPTYPYPDSNNLHLPANGYRWFGAQFGKVMHRVLILGHVWRPLYPIRATRRGAEILVDFHVPHPPLAWGTPYRSTTVGGANTAQDYASKGFTVAQSTGGALTISSVSLVSESQVLITLSSTPPDSYTLIVRYADGANNGTGMLRDSDPTVADDNYIYDTGAFPTQGTVDNIAGLNGTPYPLWNWCCASQIDVEHLTD